MSSSFQSAATYMSTKYIAVPDSIKLEIYGLYKYLTVSKIPNTPRPSLFDVTSRVKWDSWQAIGDKYGDLDLQSGSVDAETRYITIAKELGWSGESVIEALPPPVIDPDKNPDDIWDVEYEVEELKASTIGPVLSSLAREIPTSSLSTMHDLALDNKPEELSNYLMKAKDLDPMFDIDKRDENGYTTLHLAADRGYTVVVQVLLQHAAKRDIKDPDDFTAAELARISGHEELAVLISR